MSNFDHVVTQWMAPWYVDLRRAWISSQVHVVGCSTRPSTRNVHVSVASFGVTSALSTGQSSPASYWPGGRRGSRARAVRRTLVWSPSRHRRSPASPVGDGGWMRDGDLTHLDTSPTSQPSDDGCHDCLLIGGRWVHLRMCQQCGHVGCCDNSPNRHATAHYHETAHSDRSFEPARSGSGATPMPPVSHLDVPGPSATRRRGSQPDRLVACEAAAGATMPGIVSYGAYLPHWRLQRAAIGRRSAAAVARAPAASRATTRTRRRWASSRAARPRRRTRRLRAGAGGLRHDRAGVRRQDERHGDPRRPRAPRRSPAFDAVGAIRSGVGRRGWPRPPAASPCSPTSAPAVPAPPTRRRRRRRRDAGVRHRRRHRRGRRRGVGDRRVHRPLAGAGRRLLPAVGGALRRARLRAARRAGRDGRAQGSGRPSTTSTT